MHEKHPSIVAMTSHS